MPIRLLLTAFAVVTVAAIPYPAAAQERPNIVLIVADDLEGIDLLPILRGTAPPIERTIFWRVGAATGQPRAVRSGDWKLVLDGSKQLLFDVARDPGERDDLAAQHTDRVRRLKEMLDAWEKDVGATAGR